MKFKNIQVGDEVGIRSDSIASAKHYSFGHEVVTDVRDTEFEVGGWGWFSKKDGRRSGSVHQVVTEEERDANNQAWNLGQKTNRLKQLIQQQLTNLDHTPEACHILETVAGLLSSAQVKPRAEAPASDTQQTIASE